MVRYVIQKPPRRSRAKGETAEGSLRLQHTGAGQILLRDLSAGNKAMEDEKLEKMRQPRRREREQIATEPSAKIRLQRYKSGDMQEEVRRVGSRANLRKVKSREGGWRAPKRARGSFHREASAGGWDLEHIAVCVCCGLATYVLMAVLKA